MNNYNGAFLDSDPDGFGPPVVHDRPRRPLPSEIPNQAVQPWIPGNPEDTRNSRTQTTSAKTIVSRTVSIILPLSGIAIIAFIGVKIAGLLFGIYN